MLLKRISILIFMCIFILNLNLFADENPAETEKDAAGAKAEKEEEKQEQEKEELEALRELREKTIKYGIETQVQELIAQLKDEKNERFNEELAALFNKTENNDLQASILDHFTHLEDDSLKEAAHARLEEFEDLPIKLVNTIITYLEPRQNEEITASFFEMRNAPRINLASRAIRAVGESGDTEYSQKLLDFLDSYDYREGLQSEIIAALGKLGSEESVDYISGIATDEDLSNSIRWRACQALGDIGGDEAFEVISSLLNDEDPYLRAYAVGALGGFGDKKESVDILMDALRDQFWRVRVQAAKSLEQLKSKEAVDILEYKVYHDPDVKNVRMAALQALAAMDSNEVYDIMRDMMLDQNIPMLLRAESVRILVEKDLSSSLKKITELIETEWDKEKSYILDYTCKQLSTTKDSSLKPLFAKMLSHPKQINILIYGLRGVRLNKIGSLKEEVEKMTGKNYARSVRQLAQAVLDEI